MQSGSIGAAGVSQPSAGGGSGGGVAMAATYAALAATVGATDGDWAVTLDNNLPWRWSATPARWVPPWGWKAGAAYFTGTGGAKIKCLLADASVPTWGTATGIVTKSAGVPLVVGSNSYIEGTPNTRGPSADRALLIAKLAAVPTQEACIYLAQPVAPGSTRMFSCNLGRGFFDGTLNGSQVGVGQFPALVAGSWVFAHLDFSNTDNLALGLTPDNAQQMIAAPRSAMSAYPDGYAGVYSSLGGSLSLDEFHILDLGGA